jgi:hypothetical protein
MSGTTGRFPFPANVCFPYSLFWFGPVFIPFTLSAASARVMQFLREYRYHHVVSEPTIIS